MDTNLLTEWFQLLGPMGSILFFVVYAMLADRGILPKFWQKRNGNGNGQKIDLETLLNNHVAHLETAVKNLEKETSFHREKIDKIYDWSEKEMRELKDDIKSDISDRFKSVHDRMDRIEKRIDNE